MFDIVNYHSATAPPTIPSHDLFAALMSLIAMIYTLRTPLTNLILRIRPKWQKYSCWILYSLGVFTILLKVILFEIYSGKDLPWLLNNPVSYEFFAFLLFISSPLSILLFAHKTIIFNSRNHTSFYEEIRREISKGGEENVQAAFELLMANLDAIFITIKSKDKKLLQSAKEIANVVLSDSSIVKILTNKRLDKLIHFFKSVEKYELGSMDLIVCMPQIIRSLFLDPQSFCYKHLEMNGLAITSNIYDVFSFPYLIKKFNLLDDCNLGDLNDKEFNAIRTEVFLTAFQKLINVYKNYPNIPFQHINSGLRNLNEIFGGLCSKIAGLEKQELNINYEAKEEKKGLSLIASFLGRFEGYDESTINTNETNQYHLTLNAAFASSLSKALENLAYIKNKYLLYYTTLSLFNNLELQHKTTLDYRNEIEKQILKKINKNVIQRLYPTTLRTCLAYLGPRLVPDCFQPNEWMNNLIEKIRRLLYIDLVPLLYRSKFKSWQPEP